MSKRYTELLMAMGRQRSGSRQDPLPLNIHNVSETSQQWGMSPASYERVRQWFNTENALFGSMASRYGGTPSGPGDFFLGDFASARSSATEGGGGGSCKRGWG